MPPTPAMPAPDAPPSFTHKRVAVVTGSRAEFGLLLPVMRAIEAHPSLTLLTVVCGSHLLPPAETINEVRRSFRIDATVPMQDPDLPRTRATDALAVGRGIVGFSSTFDRLNPEWVVVLGDRIEAFAAAAAASIGGRAVAHLHGGDRAEGIADEAMRHAITKLAHLHLPATRQSAERIARMGEDPAHIVVVGSPAIDGLADVHPMSDADAAELGDPRAALLLHPSGLSNDDEARIAEATIAAARAEFGASTVLCFMPNHDPGRDAIAAVLRTRCRELDWPLLDHLPRPAFLSLLRRLALRGGVLIGNSSAGLIEAAALGLPVANIGPRQAGRERPDNVVDASHATEAEIAAAIRTALLLDRSRITHPYGDGRAGPRAAEALAATDPHAAGLLRKRCTY